MKKINQPHDHVKELLGSISSMIREELQKSNGSGTVSLKNDSSVPEDKNGKQIYTAVEAEVEHPLDKLTNFFKLTELERDMLLFALAPAIDAGYLNTYEKLNPIPGSHYLTPWIVKRILQLPVEREVELRKACKENSQLFLCGLLKNSEQKVNLMMRPLVIEERIVDYLLGDNDFDLRLKNFLKPVSLDATGEALVISHSQAEIDSAISNIEMAISCSKSIYLYGRESDSRIDFAGKAALKEGKGLLCLNLQNLDGRRMKVEEFIHLVFREASLQESTLFFESFEGSHSPAIKLEFVADLSRNYSVRVIVSSDKVGRYSADRTDMVAVEVPTF